MKDVNLVEYREDVERLLPYLSWFETKAGAKVSKYYDDNGLSSSTIAFPVYETMLLNFINDASKSELMDRNYAYVYSEYSLKTPEDELKAIADADIKTAEVLTGILSKYVLGGMTKGAIWTLGVEKGIFFAILKKMKALLEIWDKPLA